MRLTLPRVLTLSLFVASCVGVGPLAAEDCCASKVTAAHQTVKDLNARWDTHAQDQQLVAVEKRAAMSKELATVAERCPVGSRIGKTLELVREGLATVLSAKATCPGTCSGAGGDEPCCQNLSGPREARMALLKDLHTLATHSAQAMTPGGCSAAKGTTTIATKDAGCSAAEKASCASQTVAGGCSKSGATTTAKATTGSFCATTLATAVRAEKCDDAARTMLMAKVPGLTCEKTAAGLVTSVREAGCEKSAATVLTRAAAECAPAHCATSNTTKITTPDAGCSAAEKASCASQTAAGGCSKSEATATAQVTTGCSASVETVASRAHAIQKCWSAAPGEYAALPADARRKLHSTVEKVLEKHESARLVIASVTTLAEGLNVVSQIDQYLLTPGAEHSAPITKLPASFQETYRSQARLVSELARTLEQARNVMKEIGKQTAVAAR